MKHSFNPVVTPIIPTLDALRGEIDLIDDAILTLLEQRYAVTRRVSRAKASGSILPIRPQRERSILKRLSARAIQVPSDDIAHIWRSILTLSARSQKAYRVMLWSPKDTRIAPAGLAATRFGTAVPVLRAASSQEAIKAAQAGDAILLMPADLVESSQVPELDLIGQYPLDCLHHPWAAAMGKLAREPEVPAPGPSTATPTEREWRPARWKRCVHHRLPAYGDPQALKTVEAQLIGVAPVVDVHGVDALTAGLIKAQQGRGIKMVEHLVRVVAALTITLALAPTAAEAQYRAPDGVTVDEDGRPQYSTFSLCAVDPVTGQSGAAVTTRVAFVGRAVPWARAGVGAVCTQASTMVEYGTRGLDLMAKGVEPRAAIAQLLAADAGRESRQLGMIDMKGRSAAHTGKGNGDWAGSRQGLNYTVQANIMVGPEVVEAVAKTFESTEGSGMPLAERMILALEAGQAKGGDRRWGNLQSAAIKVADPNDPGRGGDHITLAIEVGEHAEPVAELKRIYYTTGRRLGYRTFSRIEGPDVVELKRMLHALGYWRPALTAFPAAPAVNALRNEKLRKTDPAAFDKAQTEARRLAAKFLSDFGQYDAEAIAAVDKFREDKALIYAGNPPGLVDERLVAALTAAYREKRKISFRLQFDETVRTNPLGRGDDVNGAILVALKVARHSRHPP